MDIIFAGTSDDIEALELGGNQLVNACYEATVAKEKEGRDKRKYGYEAFLFEKYVNLTFFDEILYKNMISQARKALVEKRFNKSLRGYNLKKTAAEDEESESSNDIDGSTSSHGESAAPRRARRNVGMQRAQSARGLQGRRQMSSRRLRSARNIMADVEPEPENGGNRRPSMSRQRLNSIRRELLDDREERRTATKVTNISDDEGAPPTEERRVRRQMSNRRLSGRNLMDGVEGGGMRRNGSNSRLGPEGGGMRRTGSRTTLVDGDGRGTLRNGRHRLSKRNILQD